MTVGYPTFVGRIAGAKLVKFLWESKINYLWLFSIGFKVKLPMICLFQEGAWQRSVLLFTANAHMGRQQHRIKTSPWLQAPCWNVCKKFGVCNGLPPTNMVHGKYAWDMGLLQETCFLHGALPLSMFQTGHVQLKTESSWLSFSCKTKLRNWVTVFSLL